MLKTDMHGILSAPGPNGECDWMPMDPEIDFVAMCAGFSELVMGRRSCDVFVGTGGAPGALAAAGLVDGFDVAIVPMVAPPAPAQRLRLRSNRLYPATGVMSLEYDVVR